MAIFILIQSLSINVGYIIYVYKSGINKNEYLLYLSAIGYCSNNLFIRVNNKVFNIIIT